MARLADAEIKQLKQEVSLERLVQAQGIKLKRHGQDLIGLCPFHDDHEPSLVITPGKNLWNCLGACQTGGSVIDWVMKSQGVSFRHACEILQDDPGRLSGTGARLVKRATTRKLASSLVADQDDQALLRQIVDYYHETLKQNPEALEYLESRGLNDPELINTFRLGYANRTLGYRLPEKNRKAGAEIRERLQRIGILRQSGHEHFNGSLVVPVTDEQGRITEVYGRKLLGKRLRKGTPQHLYLPGPHEGLWNASALAAHEEIILCEALIDAMTFWVHGLRNVTASYGTSGFTASHLAAFKQHGVARVLIAYDRDEAGNKAAEALAAQLQAEGIDCFRVLFPKGMDANEYAQKMSPPEKALGLAIRKAEWLGQGKAPELSAQAEPVIETAAVSHPAPEPAPEPEPESAPEQTASPAPASFPESASSPQPKAPEPIEAEVTEQEIVLSLGDRQYRVRGLAANGLEQLKINLMVKRDEAFHMDKLDLYSAKQRTVFVNQASLELGVKDAVIKADLGKLLLKLEALQEQQRSENRDPESEPKALSDGEQQAALQFLKAPDLLSRILADFTLAGVVGEETNKLVGYLACVSRKLEKPLAVMIQSSSAAGKSSLMESILALIPEEERVQYSAMTGQSLFYMGETNLKHKILAIAEEEGAHNASYALKLLQSEGEITIASTGKDDSSGNLVTREYKVEGPVMLFLTTTAIDIDEELLNRCLVLSVDEGREQTQAIHAAQRQRRTLAGLQAKLTRDGVISLHRNAQRMLRPLPVINPYADQLTFLDNKTRTRRDHEKYLTLIDTIALLHQYQRPIKTVAHDGQTIEYIEVTLADIEVANRLAHEVLGKTLDELPPQTRKLLKQVVALVDEACQAQGIERGHYRFSRKTIRDYTGWSDGQLKIHCRRLEEMEYLLVHRGGRGQAMEYELLYNGQTDEAQPHLMGLINMDQLKNQGYDAQKSGTDEGKSGPGQGQVGPKLGADQTGPNGHKACTGGSGEEMQFDFVAQDYLPHDYTDASHRSDGLPLVAQAEG